jgi:transcriptional antiterminator NusG
MMAVQQLVDPQPVPERKVWRGNEHITIRHFDEVQVGDVVGLVDVAPKTCAVLVGPARWYVLRVIPMRETVAARELILAGYRSKAFKVYRRAPLGRRGADGRREIIEVERPMMPGYVLCDLREGIHDFNGVKKVKGIIDFLRMDGHVRVASDSDVQRMAAAEASEYAKYLAAIAPKPKVRTDLEVGETVRISDGPYAHFSAQIAKLDDRGRVKLLLNMFGRATPTCVDGAILEKV